MASDLDRISQPELSELIRRATEGRLAPGDLSRAFGICADAGVPVPDCFTAKQMREAKNQTKVYLAFFGSDGQVSHLKIGVAQDVMRRMTDIHTTNPLDRILTFASPFESLRAAMQVESGLLEHMSHSKAHGEWVHFKASQQACRALADSLAEVAAEVCGHIVAFSEV